MSERLTTEQLALLNQFVSTATRVKERAEQAEAERDEAVAKQRIDEAQCDDMTATAARLAEHVSQAEARERALREALKAIYTAARGDEKSECWTIRQWLDAHDVFNGDLQGAERLIAEACKAALAATREEPVVKKRIGPISESWECSRCHAVSVIGPEQVQHYSNCATREEPTTE
jgi:hypothetical protein